MTIYATQNPEAGEIGLGWSEAQSAGATEAALLALDGTLSNGDTIRFRGNYDMEDGKVVINADNVTIEGMVGGAGLTYTNTATFADNSSNIYQFEINGDNFTVRDMELLAPQVVCGHPVKKRLFDISASGFTAERNKIQDDWSNYFNFSSGSHNGTISRNEFYNPIGYASGRTVNSFTYPVVAAGGVNNLTYEFNFVHRWLHEHIKTGVPDGGCSGWSLDNNFVLNLGRDFIDTTGGLVGASLTNNIVNQAAQFIDAKWTSDVGVVGSMYVDDVTITGNKLIDVTNLVTSTISDKASDNLLTLTPGTNYYRTATPRNIYCGGNELHNCSRLGLIKAGKNIQFVDTLWYGPSSLDFDIFTHSAGNSSSQVVTLNPMRLEIADAYWAWIGSSVDGAATHTGTVELASIGYDPQTPAFAYGPFSDGTPLPGLIRIRPRALII